MTEYIRFSMAKYEGCVTMGLGLLAGSREHSDLWIDYTNASGLCCDQRLSRALLYI